MSDTRKPSPPPTPIPHETAEWHDFLTQHCAEQERLRLERLARCAAFEMET